VTSVTSTASSMPSLPLLLPLIFVGPWHSPLEFVIVSLIYAIICITFNRGLISSCVVFPSPTAALIEENPVRSLVTLFFIDNKLQIISSTL
jgi:hypothetical protein